MKQNEVDYMNEWFRRFKNYKKDATIKEFLVYAKRITNARISEADEEFKEAYRDTLKMIKAWGRTHATSSKISSINQ